MVSSLSSFLPPFPLQVHFPVSAAHDVPRVPRRAVEPTAGREAMHVSPGDAPGGAERRRSGEGRGQGRKDPLLAAPEHAGEYEQARSITCL